MIGAGDVGVTVRAATIQDAESIAAVQVASWRAAYRGLLPDGYLSARPARDRQVAWARTLGGGAGPRITVVATADEERIVGFVDVCRSRDEDAISTATGEITSLYVLSERWGTGVGRVLVGHAEGWLRDAGFTAATLWVLDRNARARQFYERVGWHVDGAEKHVLLAGSEVVEVRYRRTLLASHGSPGGDPA